MGPFQVRVYKIHHPFDIAPVVGQERLTNDPFVLVAHLESLTTVMHRRAAGVTPSPKLPATTRLRSAKRSLPQTPFRLSPSRGGHPSKSLFSRGQLTCHTSGPRAVSYGLTVSGSLPVAPSL